MNLTQFALMSHRATGLGGTAADYFHRSATTGEDRPRSVHEAKRVIEFCQRVQWATPEILPGQEGEGNDLWCEANEVIIAVRKHLEAMETPGQG